MNDSYLHKIQALSTKEFKFGPAIEYVSSADLVNISQLLTNEKIKKQIILSTNQGKVVVAPFKKGWSPISDYFKNYGTLIVNPIRFYSDNSIYGKKGKGQVDPAIDYTTYGNQTLYLVVLKRKHLGTVTYPIWKDVKVQYFEGLDFTKESLESKDSLKDFILKARSNKKIEFDAIDTIVDFQAYVNNIRKKYSINPIPLKAENWYTYHVVDKIQTHCYNLKEYYRKEWQKKYS